MTQTKPAKKEEEIKPPKYANIREYMTALIQKRKRMLNDIELCREDYNDQDYVWLICRYNNAVMALQTIVDAPGDPDALIMNILEQNRQALRLPRVLESFAAQQGIFGILADITMSVTAWSNPLTYLEIDGL